MRITTTLYQILLSSAKHYEGYDNFYNNETNQLITQGGSDAFINQVHEWTPLVQKVANREIFGSFSFKDPAVDQFFKKTFINRFIDREPKYQTLDIFRNKLVGYMVQDEKWFTNVFDHFDDMFQSLSNSSSEATGDTVQDSTGEGRGANATLPQDNTGLDLNNDIVNYADSTDYNKTKDHQTNNTINKAHSLSNSFNADVIEKMNNVFNRKFNEYDAELFLQIW